MSLSGLASRPAYVMEMSADDDHQYHHTREIETERKQHTKQQKIKTLALSIHHSRLHSDEMERPRCIQASVGKRPSSRDSYVPFLDLERAVAVKEVRHFKGGLEGSLEGSLEGRV